MGDPDRRGRSRSGRVLYALIWGMALGAASGAVLGGAIDGVGAGAGALIGAALYAPAEAITSIRRSPAEPKPLWHRILSSALLMALFGWLLGLIYGSDKPLLTGIISGGLIGLLGLRPLKAALGLLVGAVLGALFQALTRGVEPALIAAAVTLAYRVIAAIAYRGRQLARVMAEEVPASELRYVVPFEARSMYVGADYVAMTYALSRRQSQPARAPSTSPASGPRGSSVATLTRMPSARPITAPRPMAARRSSGRVYVRVRPMSVSRSAPPGAGARLRPRRRFPVAGAGRPVRHANRVRVPHRVGKRTLQRLAEQRRNREQRSPAARQAAASQSPSASLHRPQVFAWRLGTSNCGGSPGGCRRP